MSRPNSPANSTGSRQGPGEHLATTPATLATPGENEPVEPERIEEALPVEAEPVATPHQAPGDVRHPAASPPGEGGGDVVNASRLDRQERRELAVTLRAEGLSTRAIASATGADRKTVMNDVRGGDLVENGPSATEQEPQSTPAPVTGLDGKRYEIRGEHGPEFPVPPGARLGERWRGRASRSAGRRWRGRE